MLSCRWWSIGLAAASLLAISGDAFTAPSAFLTRSGLQLSVGVQKPCRRTARNGNYASPRTRLFSTEDYGNDSGSATGTENDFRTFLNQCTLQSFMFLLGSTRDPHTIRWLDNFTQPAIDSDEIEASNVRVDFGDGSSYVDADKIIPSELLRFHGIGAMNMTLFPTWESYFRGLLEQNETTLVVETYDPRFPQFEIDVNPASLCSRILSVREQIAREFASDLGAIANMGREIFNSYWEQVEKARAEGMDEDGNAMSKGFDRQSLIFLEWDPNYDEDARPSPLRKGNYDLLVLLCTQESIHRLIRDGIQLGEETETQVKENTMFLRKFYAERLHSHFTGSLHYGRADDFLEELMLSPPRITTGDQNTLVDPVFIAEAILLERDRVALEWKEVANQSPQEHMEIRKLQLNKMMGLPVERVVEGFE